MGCSTAANSNTGSILAISTILDLFVAYFFMHPLVSILARRPHLVRMRGVGIEAGLDAAHEPERVSVNA